MNYDEYVAGLGAQHRFGKGDRLGTANLIDSSARRRAAGAVRSGESFSLARPVVDVGDNTHSFDIDVFVVDIDIDDKPLGFAMDRVELRCHGLMNTHLDALNHIAIDGTYYGGLQKEDPQLSSMADLAVHGLVTRGVVVDVPASRGEEWVSADEPVTGDDIDRALGSTEFLTGDALLLYMGRDRFESAGSPATEARHPGVGRSGAEWIADHGVSIVCWDFLDATHDGEPAVCVHRLIPAIGLLLVDNCHLAGAAAAVRDRNDQTGALLVAPIAIPGGTGCYVTPLLVL